MSGKKRKLQNHKPRKIRRMVQTPRQRYVNNHAELFEKYVEYTNQDLRDWCFEILGGEVCLYCGFDDRRALTIDHIDGGGSRERKEMGARGVYIKLIEHEGVGYQVLCLNCQSVKRIEEEET